MIAHDSILLVAVLTRVGRLAGIRPAVLRQETMSLL